MVARVLQAKSNAQQSEVVRQLNGRIRQVINSRIYWSDLVTTRIIPIPNAYNTGTVAYATGDNTVVGSGTAWPINDVVNTTVTGPAGVQDTGYQEITPASMTGINVDRFLYCDALGTPEIVSVIEVTPVSFWAKFTQAHNPNFTITSSSLAGLQLNPGTNYPTFTVRAITSATTLEMDNPWGGPAITAQPYAIFRQYCTIDPNLKVIIDLVDQQAGRQLETYTPIEALNLTDPQRTATGDPLALAQAWPTEAGTMQYEIWPWPTAARQLSAIVGLQWPELKSSDDRPPWFIDPNLFVIGAIADSLRIKNLRMGSDKDPYFDPNLAREYEAMFQFQLQQAVNADEAKAQRAYQYKRSEIFGAGGANFWRDHDMDLNAWRL